MPELTDTEIVAKLLGWEKAEREGHYRKGPYYAIAHDIPGLGGSVFRSDGNRIEESFPDLTNWNDIRRMEAALYKAGLFPKYCRELAKDRFVFISNPVEDIGEVLLLRSQTDCVAAAVKVLREVQG